jgi:hypothetical protein
MSNKIWLAIAAVVGYVAVKKYVGKVVTNIEQKFKRVHFEGFKNMRANFSVTYSIENKNPDPIYIYDFKAMLTWRSMPFADIASVYTEVTPLELTPTQNKEFTAYFSLPMIDVLADLVKILWGQRPPEGATYEGMNVKGSTMVKMKGVQSVVPFDYPVVFSV